MIYIKYTYDQTLSDSEPTYIGPFPDADFVSKHRELYGPANSRHVSLTSEVPEDAYVMSPGQAVDYTLRML